MKKHKPLLAPPISLQDKKNIPKLIKWAKAEITEYQKFIKQLKEKLK